LLSVLALGLLLGIKHAVEPDHIVAVSTIASKSGSLLRASLAGVFWGIGHTATLFAAGIAVIALKGDIPDTWALSLEFLVGLMLVCLGAASFRSLASLHVHEHAHEGRIQKHVHALTGGEGRSHRHAPRPVSYRTSAFVGLVHGLAGSGAMALLAMSAVSSVWEAAVYILVFGAGTVVGMLVFTTVIGLPFVLTARKLKVNLTLARLTGAVSVVFGIYYMYRLGIQEGLFSLWLS